MKAKYFRSEKDFYASLPESKREAARKYWDNKTENELTIAKLGYLQMEYKSEVELAVADEEMASSLLEVAACFLQDRKPMPYYLADYIAEAFRKTATINESIDIPASIEKRNMLARMLNITAPNCRPKSNLSIIGSSVYRLIMMQAQDANFISETKALEQVAADENLGITQAKKYWKEWKNSNPDAYELLKNHIILFKKL